MGRGAMQGKAVTLYLFVFITFNALNLTILISRRYRQHREGGNV